MILPQLRCSCGWTGAGWQSAMTHVGHSTGFHEVTERYLKEGAQLKLGFKQ